jgi:hypothetical protein
MSWIRNTEKYRDNKPSLENVGRKLRTRKGEPRRPEIKRGANFRPTEVPSRDPQGGEGGASSIIINTGYHQEIRM